MSPPPALAARRLCRKCPGGPQASHRIIKCVLHPHFTQHSTDTSFPINLKNWLVVTSHIKLNAVFSPLVFTLATYNCWSVTNGKCCLVVVMCPTNEPLHFKPGPEKADHTAWAGPEITSRARNSRQRTLIPSLIS